MRANRPRKSALAHVSVTSHVQHPQPAGSDVTETCASADFRGLFARIARTYNNNATWSFNIANPSHWQAGLTRPQEQQQHLDHSTQHDAALQENWYIYDPRLRPADDGPLQLNGLQQLLASAALVAPPTYTATNALSIDATVTSHVQAPQESPPPYSTPSPSCTPPIRGVPPPTYDQALIDRALASSFQRDVLAQHLTSPLTSQPHNDPHQHAINDALADDVIAHWEQVLLPHSASVATSPCDTLTSQPSEAGGSVTSQAAMSVLVALRQESLSEVRQRGCFQRPAIMWNRGSWSNNRLMNTLTALAHAQ